MLKPSSFEVNVIYQCPICLGKHWYSVNELKSKPILLCCNEVFEIQPIKNVKLSFKFNNHIPDGAIKVLKQYGFTIEELKESGIDAKTAEEYVKKFLASRLHESSTDKVK